MTPSTFLDEDAMDTSETLAGKREQPPVEGAMDSDVPTQSIDRESRLGDIRPACVMEGEVVKARAQWWRRAMKKKSDTLTRMDPRAPWAVNSGGPAFSAWAAEERNRILGRQLTVAEERAFADLFRRRRGNSSEFPDQRHWASSRKIWPIRGGR